jgi:hypothetical protein
LHALVRARQDRARPRAVAIVAEVSADNWWCASIPAKELPVGQVVPRRLVNVRIPRILIRMQERAQEVPRSQRR